MTVRHEVAVTRADPTERIVALAKAETDFLDRGDLKAWMSLFSEDGVYWMPSHPGQTDPHTEISLILEDRALMEIRAANFGHQLSASMAHPIGSCRMIDVTSVEPCSDLGCDWKLRAKFFAAISYRQTQSVYAGRYEYLVRLSGEEPRIRQKRVDLINAESPLPSIMSYI